MKNTCQLSVVSSQLSFCTLYFELGTLMWSQSKAEILKRLWVRHQSTKHEVQSTELTTDN